jgi:hypothetical protein
MTEPITKLRGEHCLNVFVSYQLKQRIIKLAEKYDPDKGGHSRHGRSHRS